MRFKKYLLGTAILFSLSPVYALAAPKKNKQFNQEIATPAATSSNAKVVMNSPIISNSPNIKGAVTLNAKDYSSLTKAVKVKKTFNFNTVKSSPKIEVQGTKLDFSSFINNKDSIYSIGQALSSKPNLAKVTNDLPEINEIEGGVLVRSALSYQITGGNCSSTNGKSDLASIGITCFKYASIDSRIAEFSKPGSVHYVADAAQRNIAIANYQTYAAQEQADLDSQTDQLQNALKDPIQKNELIKKLGQAEVNRLSGLSRQALQDDIVNSGEMKVEQVVFIPTTDKFSHIPDLQQLGNIFEAQNAPPKGGSPKDKTFSSTVQELVGNNASAAIKPTTELDFGPYIYLTGFTLGREHEWSTRVEYTVDVCKYIPFVKDCPKTYYVEPYAGFNYGFGLRFPIEVNAHYSYPVLPGNTESARVEVEYVPINGNKTQYLDAGIDSDQLFEGKELVAQFGAEAGFDYSLPLLHGNLHLGAEIDFTDDLPAPFTNGQFTPPEPGGEDLEGLEVKFPQFDLLMGRGNYGIVGVVAFPMVKIDLHANSLKFNLEDMVGGTTTKLKESERGTNVKVSLTGTSEFKVKDPSYNLSFLVTPGINAQAFVDVAVWSHDWNWPIWLPQAEIELPPGGMDFTCHEGTDCSRKMTAKAFETKFAPQSDITVQNSKIDAVKPSAGSETNNFVTPKGNKKNKALNPNNTSGEEIGIKAPTNPDTDTQTPLGKPGKKNKGLKGNLTNQDVSAPQKSDDITPIKPGQKGMNSGKSQGQKTKMKGNKKE